MARYAIVVAGAVVNVIEADASFAATLAEQLGGSAVLSATAGPGDTHSGGNFTTPEPTAHVPKSVTMRQARLALLGAGLLASVETALDALSEPAKSAARIEWDYSNELLRANPLVATLGAALGLSSGQIDNLFVAAAAL
ncbi:MAG: hypothetical protein RLZZ524_1822 [Pseudomonadota bacterium]